MSLHLDLATVYGSFTINDVQLSIGPQNIQIYRDDLTYQYKTLRTNSSTKIPTGRGRVSVSLSMVFLKENLLELHRIITQFRNSPFCFIENRFLREQLATEWPLIQNMAFTLNNMSTSMLKGAVDALQVNMDLTWFNYFPYMHNFLYRKEWQTKVTTATSETNAGAEMSVGERYTIGWDINSVDYTRSPRSVIIAIEASKDTIQNFSNVRGQETSTISTIESFKEYGNSEEFDLLPRFDNMERSGWVVEPSQSDIYKRYCNYLQRDSLLKHFGIDIEQELKDHFVPGLSIAKFPQVTGAQTVNTQGGDWSDLFFSKGVILSKDEVALATSTYSLTDYSEHLESLKLDWVERMWLYHSQLQFRFHDYLTYKLSDEFSPREKDAIHNAAKNSDKSALGNGEASGSSDLVTAIAKLKPFILARTQETPEFKYTEAGDGTEASLSIFEETEVSVLDGYNELTGHNSDVLPVITDITMGATGRNYEERKSLNPGSLHGMSKEEYESGGYKSFAHDTGYATDLKVSLAGYREPIGVGFDYDGSGKPGTLWRKAYEAWKMHKNKPSAELKQMIMSSMTTSEKEVWCAWIWGMYCIKMGVADYNRYYGGGGDHLINGDGTRNNNGPLSVYGLDNDPVHVQFMNFKDRVNGTVTSYETSDTTEPTKEQQIEDTLTSQGYDTSSPKFKKLLDDVATLMSNGWQYYDKQSDVSHVWERVSEINVNNLSDVQITNYSEAEIVQIFGNHDLIVTGISASLQNLVASIPIVGQEYPTQQYLGSIEPKYSIEIANLDTSPDLSGISENARALMSMRSRLQSNARQYRLIPDGWSLQTDTFFTRLMGSCQEGDFQVGVSYEAEATAEQYELLKRTCISSCHSATVEKQPGLSIIQLSLEETNPYTPTLVVNEGVRFEDAEDIRKQIIQKLKEVALVAPETRSTYQGMPSFNERPTQPWMVEGVDYNKFDTNNSFEDSKVQLSKTQQYRLMLEKIIQSAERNLAEEDDYIYDEAEAVSAGLIKNRLYGLDITPSMWSGFAYYLKLSTGVSDPNSAEALEGLITAFSGSNSHVQKYAKETYQNDTKLDFGEFSAGLYAVFSRAVEAWGLAGTYSAVSAYSAGGAGAVVSGATLTGAAEALAVVAGAIATAATIFELVKALIWHAHFQFNKLIGDGEYAVTVAKSVQKDVLDYVANTLAVSYATNIVYSDNSDFFTTIGSVLPNISELSISERPAGFPEELLSFKRLITDSNFFYDDTDFISSIDQNPLGGALSRIGSTEFITYTSLNSELLKLDFYKSQLAKLADDIRNVDIDVLKELGLIQLASNGSASSFVPSDCYPDIVLPFHPYYQSTLNVSPDFYMWNAYEDGGLNNNELKRTIIQAGRNVVNFSVNSLNKLRRGTTDNAGNHKILADEVSTGDVSLRYNTEANEGSSFIGQNYANPAADGQISSFYEQLAANPGTAAERTDRAVLDSPVRRIDIEAGVPGVAKNAEGELISLPTMASSETRYDSKAYDSLREQMGQITHLIGSSNGTVERETEINGLKDRPDIYRPAFSIDDLKNSVEDCASDVFSQKMRMKRAYPTFKLYLVEEDGESTLFRSVDDFYSYSAVQKFEVVQSSEHSTDTAVITLSNISGTLDGSVRNIASDIDLMEKISRSKDESPDQSYYLDTNRETSIGSIVLRPGVNVQLSAGYSNHPDNLSVLISGRIVDVSWNSTADTVEILVQSFGAELSQVQIANEFDTQTTYYTTHELLGSMMMRPELKHFGRYKFGSYFNIGEAKDHRVDLTDYRGSNWRDYFKTTRAVSQWFADHSLLLGAVAVAGVGAFQIFGGTRAIGLAKSARGFISGATKAAKEIVESNPNASGSILASVAKSLIRNAGRPSAFVFQKVSGWNKYWRWSGGALSTSADEARWIFGGNRLGIGSTVDEVQTKLLEQLKRGVDANKAGGLGSLLRAEDVFDPTLVRELKRISDSATTTKETQKRAQFLLSGLQDASVAISQKLNRAAFTNGGLVGINDEISIFAKNVVSIEEQALSLAHRAQWNLGPLAPAGSEFSWGAFGKQAVKNTASISLVAVPSIAAGVIAGVGVVDAGYQIGSSFLDLGYTSAQKEYAKKMALLLLDPSDDNLFCPHPKDYMLIDKLGFGWKFLDGIVGGAASGLEVISTQFTGGVSWIGNALGAPSVTEAAADMTVRSWKDFFTNKKSDPVYYRYSPTGGTVWDLFHEMSLRHPGWIYAARPYPNGMNLRYTMFFGVPSQKYWARGASNAFIDRLNRVKSFLELEDKTAAALELYGTQPDGTNYEAMAMDEYIKGISARFQPFRRYHFISDAHDLVHNGIIATENAVSNAVEVVYHDLEGNPVGSRLVKAHTSIADDKLRTEALPIYPNCKGYQMALRYGMGQLVHNLKKMYRGEIVVLGNPRMRPHDVAIMIDGYNDMAGPIQIDQIVHMFSHETGFITEIKPAAITIANEASTWPLLEGVQVMVYAMDDLQKSAVYGDSISDSAIPLLVALAGQKSKWFDSGNANTEEIMERAKLRGDKVARDFVLSDAVPDNELINLADGAIGEVTSAVQIGSALGAGGLLGTVIGAGTKVRVAASNPVVAGVTGGWLLLTGTGMLSTAVTGSKTATWLLGSTRILAKCLEEELITVVPLTKNGQPLIAGLETNDPYSQLKSFFGDLNFAFHDVVDGSRDMLSLYNKYGGNIWAALTDPNLENMTGERVDAVSLKLLGD